jgi:NADPH:quinone reductase-like Zn-dependent oxidoreductase
MKSLRFNRFGDPREVLEIQEIPTPEPGRGEVRVRMLASPINPSDLLVVRGEYGRLPQLPATPGFEGVGIVESAGGGLLSRLRKGKRVAVLNGQGGNWQEQVVLPARQVVPLPAEISDDQGAAFFVNPASAVIMTRYVLKVPAGAWLLQTAAGSALGRMIIRLGTIHGFRTINVVRRRAQAEELLRVGGDEVICTADESVEERTKMITGGAGIPFAVDAVGGATGSAVVRALGPGGRLLVYGTLGAEPLTIDPRVLMSGDKRVEAFWLSNWVRQQGPLGMLALFRQIRKLMASGVISTQIAATFGFDQFGEAIRQAETPGRAGKVLLRMSR